MLDAQQPASRFNQVFLAMEMQGGGSLSALIRRQAAGRLSEPRAVSWVLQPLLSALCYLHGRGIIHRDLTPGGMMRCPCRTSNISIRVYMNASNA